MPQSLLDANMFWNTLTKIMNERRCADFQARYNNEQIHRRARNSRPRTNLMVGGSDSVLGLVIAELKSAGHLPADGEMSFTRYIDLGYASGDWWKGKKWPHLAIEVENDFAELRGTLSDLFLFQAGVKVAIFYSPNPEQHKKEVEEAVSEVAAGFAEHGFVEAPGTQYLLVLAPDECREERGMDGDGVLSLGLTFSGLTAPIRFDWLSSMLWSSVRVA